VRPAVGAGSHAAADATGKAERTTGPQHDGAAVAVCEATKLDRKGDPQAGAPQAGAATVSPQSDIPHPLALTPHPTDEPPNRLRRRSSRLTRPPPHDPHAADPNDAEANVGDPYTGASADPQLVHPWPCTTMGTGLADASMAELSNNREAFTREPPVP